MQHRVFSGVVVFTCSAGNELQWITYILCIERTTSLPTEGGFMCPRKRKEWLCTHVGHITIT